MYLEACEPTPTVDPQMAIIVKPYRIPVVNNDEVQKQTEQILAYGVI